MKPTFSPQAYPPRVPSLLLVTVDRFIQPIFSPYAEPESAESVIWTFPAVELKSMKPTFSPHAYLYVESIVPSLVEAKTEGVINIEMKRKKTKNFSLFCL